VAEQSTAVSITARPNLLSRPAAHFAITALAFVALNFSAYRGYFMHDDFEFLSWAPKVPALEYLKTFFEPIFSAHNFRPAGHFYYHVMGRIFGLDFPPYVASIHLLHILNIGLVWLLLRKLGLSRYASAAGVLFFAFHVALFDAWWKPSYIFDMLAATFCMLALLAYLDGRWILSLLAFWAAYKSKELAVMFPAVLLSYELLLGQKRWKTLVPFFAISFCFGVQALFIAPQKVGIYAFHFDLRSLVETLPFYAKQLLLFPFSGFLLLLLPVIVRDRRVWFGVSAAILYFGPLFFLPGRLVEVYWYLPMTGVAIALGALVARGHTKAVAIFLLLWLPWDLVMFSRLRRKALALEGANRAYVSALAEFAPSHPEVHTFIYEKSPPGLPGWGIRAALNCLYDRLDSQVYVGGDSNVRSLLHSKPVALLDWDPASRILTIVDWTQADQHASYLDLRRFMSLFQLGDGWYGSEGSHIWTKPDADATLYRQPNAETFELLLVVPPLEVQGKEKVTLRAALGGQPLEPRELTRAGEQTLRWTLPPAPPGLTKVEFHTTPDYRAPQDPRVLGIAAKSFGFLPGKRP
jgi:hypothetical protein